MKKVVFLITFLLCGVFVYAQTSTENIGGLLYSIDTEAKTATLIANDGDEYEGDIVIPEKVKTKGGETYTVVSLGDKCFENCRIKSVIIPNTVKSLGDECFWQCNLLKSVYFKGKLPKYLTTYCNAPTDCSFYVPRPYLQEYIDAIGSKYSSIYPWDGGVVIVRAKSYSRVYGDENPVFELDLGG